MNRPQFIIVHHSVSPKDVPWATAERSFNNNHKARFNFKSSLGWYIGYQYVIYGNGELKQYRKDNEEGAHCKEQTMNFRSLGICISGNFDTEQPNPRQVETLRNFLLQKTKEYGIPAANIYPHRKYATYKSCYGKLLADDWARSLITNPMAEPKNQKKFVLSRKTNTVYLATPMPDQDFLKKEAFIEGIALPANLGDLPDPNSL